ncbi:unnamed protein product [Sphagnum tenellum]
MSTSQMSGPVMSELLFRRDTAADCFTETTSLTQEQLYGSVKMHLYTEDDDLEEFFRGAFATLADIGKEGVGLRSNAEVEFKSIKAEETLNPTQQVESCMPHVPHANGESQLDTKLNGVAPGLTSPAGSARSINGPFASTNGTSENFSGLSLKQTQRTRSFDTKVLDGSHLSGGASGFFQQGAQSTSAGVMPVSPGGRCLPPSSLSSLPPPMMPPLPQPQVNGVSQYYFSSSRDIPSSTIGGMGGLPWAHLQNDTSSAMFSVGYEDPVDVMHLQKQNVFVPIQQQGGEGNLLQQEESDVVDHHLRLQPRPNRQPSMLRSHSSDTLGQDRLVMHQLSLQNESSSFSSLSSQAEFTGQVTNQQPAFHSQQSDLEDMARAAYMAAPSMRRAQSAGDLQRSTTVIPIGGGNLSPMYGNTKRVGRFTLEERRQLLQRFQQKRAQRNFNKKIKYACRKSLADKRPRVRGRFARNDESTEHVSLINGHKLEDDDEVDTAMGEEDEFFLHQSSSGDLFDLLEMPVKLKRLEP